MAKKMHLRNPTDPIRSLCGPIQVDRRLTIAEFLVTCNGCRDKLRLPRIVGDVAALRLVKVEDSSHKVGVYVDISGQGDMTLGFVNVQEKHYTSYYLKITETRSSIGEYLAALIALEQFPGTDVFSDHGGVVYKMRGRVKYIPNKYNPAHTVARSKAKAKLLHIDTDAFERLMAVTRSNALKEEP